METNLLQTKLYIPSLRPNFIPRPQLMAKLDEGQPAKLILVSASAGYGKTTLITEWIHYTQPQPAVCWFALDEEDSEPQQFFTYLAAAVRPLVNTQSALAQQLQSPQLPSAKKLMAAFTNDVVPVSTPFYLVLDDYHVIDSPDIDKATAFLLDHMPPQMTLVITSRADPGFPLSRLRARSQLLEIRADDLRFSEAEVAQFLQQSMKLTLSPDQIAALESRTEGWIAGLQMAALSLQNRGDVAHFIKSFTGSHRFIMDYLLEEVLNQQPEEVKDFLLETAVLDRLCADLCDAVRKTPPASQQLLEQLENHNLFLIPLDNERRWYRYHHLFADLLQQRLQQSRTAAASTQTPVAELHRRASQWYENNGLEKKAIQHALAASDFEQAARLIELAWRKMDINLQHTQWLSWAQKVPAALIDARPVLCVGIGWAHLNQGELETAEAYLQLAERWLEAPDNAGSGAKMVVADEQEFQKLPATIASARTFAAQAIGDLPRTILFAKQALALLPEDDFLGRSIPTALLALAYWASGELVDAYQMMSASMVGFEKSGNIVAAISGTFSRADIKIAQGRLGEAQRIYERALQLAQSQDKPDIRGTEVLYLGLSELYRERGEVETAVAFWQKAELLGKQSVEPIYHYRVRVALADRKMAHGAFDEALDLLAQADPFWAQIFIPDIRPLAASKARVWLKQGRLDNALAWVQQRALSVDDELSYLQEFEHITLARVRIAQYQNEGAHDAIDEAARLLARLLQAAEDGERAGSVIEILLLQALAHEAQGDTAAALVPLERALTLAESEGYVRLFVNEGMPMARLLSMAAARQIQSNYVSKLLALLAAEGHEPVDSSPQPAIVHEQPLVDPLSEREIEILTLIAAGLKNKEVAEQLFISLNTVFYHTKNIYTKLGVNKRTLAITKAKEINLI